MSAHCMQTLKVLDTQAGIVSDRLSPRTLEGADAMRQKHQSKPLVRYSSMEEVVTCLDRWTKKWTALHNDRNESAEATVLRLAEKLTRDETIMQVGLTCTLYPDMSKLALGTCCNVG